MLLGDAEISDVFPEGAELLADELFGDRARLTLGRELGCEGAFALFKRALFRASAGLQNGQDD